MKACWIVFLLSVDVWAYNCTQGHVTLDFEKPCDYRLKLRSTALFMQCPPQGLFGAAYFYLGDTDKAVLQLVLTAMVPISAVFVYSFAPGRWLKPGADPFRLSAVIAGLVAVAAGAYWLVGLIEIDQGSIHDGQGQALNPN